MNEDVFPIENGDVEKMSCYFWGVFVKFLHFCSDLEVPIQVFIKHILEYDQHFGGMSSHAFHWNKSTLEK